MKVETLIKLLQKCDPEGRVYLRDRAVYGVITGGELVRLEPGECETGYYEHETIREAGYRATDVIIEPV